MSRFTRIVECNGKEEFNCQKLVYANQPCCNACVHRFMAQYLEVEGHHPAQAIILDNGSVVSGHWKDDLKTAAAIRSIAQTAIDLNHNLGDRTSK